MLNNLRNFKPKNSILGKISRFVRNTAGSTSLTMSLAALPVIVLAGSAIDMSRASREKTTFYSAVDGAALAIAADDRSAMAGLTTTTEKEARRVELENYAKKFIMANYKAEKNSTPTVTANLTLPGDKIVIDAHLTFPTTMMKIVGVNSMTIDAKSEIAFAARPIELVMVMDTTGSMASNSKLSGAKTAAKKLLSILYGAPLSSKPNSEFVRVALVPFAAGVRLNTDPNVDFNINWIDTTGLNPLSRLNFSASGAPASFNNYTAWSTLKNSSTTYFQWNGCVEARKAGSAASNTDFIINDVAPTSGNPDTLFPAYFAPDTPDYTNSSGSNVNYGNNYIAGTSTTASGSECKGLTSTQCASRTTTDQRLKQENYRKYQDRQLADDYQAANCAASATTPMTYDRATVEAGIDAMAANGNTLIAEGLAWGLRSISPTEPLTKVQGSGVIPGNVIAPYDGPRWRKVIVLMTDGDNNMNAGSYPMNVSTYSAYGFGGDELANNRFGSNDPTAINNAMDSTMLAVCSKIKALNIDLYVTSFGSGVSTATKNRLQACSSGDEYYSHSETTTDLVAFFDHIGKDVLNKSIYVSK